MSKHQVTCITKRGDHYDAHERISAIGGSWGKMSEKDAIQAINRKTDEFYVSAGGGTVDVIVSTHKGREYLKTRPDGISPDNLLALPNCL